MKCPLSIAAVLAVFIIGCDSEREDATPKPPSSTAQTGAGAAKQTDAMMGEEAAARAAESTHLKSKPESMKGTVVDLTPHQHRITTLLEDAVSEFSREHPDVTVSMLVVDYSGLNPYVMIAADTPEHSDAHVQKFPDDCGQDEQGKFCDSPWDCQFQLADYGFDGFPDLYQVEGPLSLKAPDGRVVLVDLDKYGDEALNAAMFQFLLPIVERFTGYRAMKRAPVFRLGVHVQDSKYSKFWRPSG